MNKELKLFLPGDMYKYNMYYIDGNEFIWSYWPRDRSPQSDWIHMAVPHK